MAEVVAEVVAVVAVMEVFIIHEGEGEEEEEAIPL
jgi:hypothetical protein